MTRCGFLLVVLTLIFLGCSGIKQAEKASNSGDYQKAIQIALNRLQKGKHKKIDYQMASVLEKAFSKQKTAYTDRIRFLKKDLEVNSGEIYELYQRLDQTQKMIAPLLPLQKANGFEARFDFENYDEALIGAKKEFAQSLYIEAQNLMKGSKQDNRKAYELFGKLLTIYPNYREANTLREEARYQGTDFVRIVVENNTSQIIPQKLQESLLDFKTYKMDNFWTEFHTSDIPKIRYDYEVVLEFVNIVFTPERVAEKLLPLERTITEEIYQKDRNGNYVLDERGNKITIEQSITVKGTLNQVQQSKAVTVSGQVHYFDLNRRQKINDFSLRSDYVFENIFAEFKGDDRVLNDNEKLMLRNRFMPFPSNEQMLLDASSDIKKRFGSILKKNTF